MFKLKYLCPISSRLTSLRAFSKTAPILFYVFTSGKNNTENICLIDVETYHAGFMPATWSKIN